MIDGLGEAARKVAPRMRVLVVDDRVDCVVSIGRLLDALGYQVRLALDGRAALDCAAEFRPEAALVDLSLPDLDGFGVAERLRAMPETRDTYLIAMTGWGTDEVRARVEAGAFDRHLVKPLSATVLSDVLSSVHRRESVPATLRRAAHFRRDRARHP
jgi:two-component system, chemotaxis family, CheB/CheR fusion protein